MTNPRDEHFQAVGFAGQAIEDFQQALATVKELQGEDAMRAVANACGAAPGSDSGANALARVADATGKIDEILMVLEEAKAEMLRYGNGF